MERLIAILLTFFVFDQAFACLNGDSKVLKDGTFLYEDREGGVPYGHDFYKDDFERGIKQLDSSYIVTKDLDYLSDKGLLLILLERYEEAIKLYLEIEKIEPNRYSTASNIGTAYELVGQNERALKWIRKSVELDPRSHNGSEWIHVKILEAKIKGERFYTTGFLLNTDFGSDVKPRSQLSEQELRNLSTALYYQLNERVSFVKPKEKVVAQLLFDLGNIAYLSGNYFDALANYEQAKLYGYTGQLIEDRIKQAEENKRQAQQQAEENNVNVSERSRYLTYGLGTLSGLLLIISAVTIYRRKKTINS